MVTDNEVAAIAKALEGQLRGSRCVIGKRHGLPVCWEVANNGWLTMIDVTLDPSYPIALRVVDGEVEGAEPAHVMKFLLDDDFLAFCRRYRDTQIGTQTIEGRELLRLSRDGSHGNLDFVLTTLDALVRVASRLEEAYHLAHAGPYR